MGAYWKDLFREIKNTPGRFISLVIITALGAASVVGIQASSIDMRDVADRMYKEYGLYDVQVKSTVGFDDGDIDALKAENGVSGVMATHIIDAFINIENENRAVRTYALPDGLNEIRLVDGRLPENPRECVVEQAVLNNAGIRRGDSVRFSLDDMDDYFKVLEYDTFTVVGVVNSPLYISLERGNTTLGDGSLRYYMYLHPDAYKLDVYTDLYIKMDAAYELNNLSDAYSDAANEWKTQLERAGELRVSLKKDELLDAQREIDDGWAEYNDGAKELREKTGDAERELEDAKRELEDAKLELEDAQLTLDRETANARREIESNAATLEDARLEAAAARRELEDGQAQLDSSRAEVQQALSDLESQAPHGVSPVLDTYYEQAYAALALLDEKQAEIDAGYAALSEAEAELENGLSQLDKARAELERERRNAQKEIDDGWVKYRDGLDEYNDGVKELAQEVADAERELDKSRAELEDAQRELDDVPEPEWYVFTRSDGLAFDSYYQDTQRLEKIGYVFPMVFFLVAVMVSLTSMSRMVEDHRTQIGVYKALGYKPFSILMKYLIYAFLASMTGGVIGVFAGSSAFPLIISDAYGHLYDMPPVDTPIPVSIALIAVASAVLAVVVVTLGTYISYMRGQPALLMRPKAPANGKRVLLERVSFVWRRLGFFSKVTARNVFRYKKRFLMTLAGVAGCAALLITAFGLRDSIAGISELQFETIIKYGARAYLKDITSKSQRDSLADALPEAHLLIREESVTAGGGEGSAIASLVVPQDTERMTDFYYLYDPVSEDPVFMTEHSVVVTEKLARMMGAAAGDRFTVTFSDGTEYSARITGIADNYIQHFIYMSPSVYAELFGESAHPNSALIAAGENRDYAAELLENENVRALIYTDELRVRIGDSTDAMGVVTVVLILLACALALVVLFNLTNINISERVRELATMKVLGLSDSELAAYIYRENGVVTLLGIALGLVGGVFLHAFVLTSVEIDILKFPNIIHAQSFLYSAALSLVFAVFVNFVMGFKLARIDMVESLKNVE